MTTSERNSSIQRMYGPIRLNQMDPQAERLALRLVRQSTEFGSKIAGYAHGDPIASVAEGVAQELFDGTARQGLSLNRICAGRTGASRIGERFVIDPLQDAVEIAARGLLLRCGFAAIHEHITSVPIRPGGDMHGFAIDQIPRRARIGHVLLDSVGSDDRTLLTQAIWLTTDTIDDYGSPRADLERIADWNRELETKLPGSLCEHLWRMFEAQRRARHAVFAAASRGSEAFATMGLDPREFLQHCFPRCVILDTFAYGTPTRKGASSETVIYPGDDDAMVAVVEEAGRHGIALCKIEEQVDLAAIEGSLLPQLAARLGEQPEPVPVSVLEEVAGWRTAENLGIGVSVRRVRYWHFKESGHLLRAVQVPGRDGGQIHDVHLWRTIRLDRSLLRETIALVERGQQPWPGTCVERYCEECEPAKMSPWKARVREGLLKTTLLSNAAGVTAHREMEVRLAAQDSQRSPVRRPRS